MAIDNQELIVARRLWSEGKTLGEISEKMGKSVYELGRWLIGDMRMVEPY